ncbi:MAG: hypothetical protein E7516_09690 [Ruminococcaceae bacterium]|nr:hypothetical protein [Oscillospiraceae bacterium]
MSKYIKPTITLVGTATASGATSSCSSSTVDSKELVDILLSMGFDLNAVFNTAEGCTQPADMFEQYCKFSSAIQVFTS